MRHCAPRDPQRVPKPKYDVRNTSEHFTFRVLQTPNTSFGGHAPPQPLLFKFSTMNNLFDRFNGPTALNFLKFCTG
jgi:hypothetical protein